MTPKLSIVIVSYRVRDFLTWCLESIVAQLHAFPYEVIVVDNHSQDGTVEVLRADFPWVRLIENNENVGFARATNRGIRESRGEYILLLNPDTLLFDRTLERMVAFAEKAEGVGAVGCKILNADRSLQSSCRNFPTLKMTLFEQLGFHKLWGKWHRDYLRTWAHNTVRKVDTVKGACMLVPKAVFERIGLLDERFFLYGEEIDFCRRIAEAGLVTYFYPDAAIIHFGEKSSEIHRLESLIALHQAQRAYFEKYTHALTVWVYTFLTLCGLAGRMLYLALIPGGSPEDERRRHRKYRLFRGVFLWYFTP